MLLLLTSQRGCFPSGALASSHNLRPTRHETRQSPYFMATDLWQPNGNPHLHRMLSCGLSQLQSVTLPVLNSLAHCNPPGSDICTLTVRSHAVLSDPSHAPKVWDAPWSHSLVLSIITSNSILHQCLPPPASDGIIMTSAHHLPPATTYLPIQHATKRTRAVVI